MWVAHTWGYQGPIFFKRTHSPVAAAEGSAAFSVAGEVFGMNSPEQLVRPGEEKLKCGLPHLEGGRVGGSPPIIAGLPLPPELG